MRDPSTAGLPGTGSSNDGTKRDYSCGIRDFLVLDSATNIFVILRRCCFSATTTVLIYQKCCFVRDSTGKVIPGLCTERQYTFNTEHVSCSSTSFTAVFVDFQYEVDVLIFFGA